MAKVLVLYYSAYGHIETMAYAVAEGAKSAGAEVTVKRVPELVPEEVAKASHFKLEQAAEIATVDELADYDAIIVGAGTRFGSIASQMRNFWDQTGSLWFAGKLIGKVGSAFTSSATQHGGQETTLMNFVPTFLHHGMVYAGLPYSFQGQMGLEEIRAARPTAQRRSPMATARASLRPSSWKGPASRAPTSPSSPPSFRPDRRRRRAATLENAPAAPRCRGVFVSARRRISRVSGKAPCPVIPPDKRQYPPVRDRDRLARCRACGTSRPRPSFCPGHVNLALRRTP